MCTVRQHLLHLGQKVNERQKKKNRGKEQTMKRMLCIVYNLQCFFFIIKTVIYCILLKEYTNFINSWKEENIRLIKDAFKKREFVLKNTVISSY